MQRTTNLTTLTFTEAKRNTFVLRVCAILVLCLLILNVAQAQITRVFPQEVRFGDLQSLDYPNVKISGKVFRLTPGARIRDRDNRIVVPNELNEGGKVAFLLDPTNQLMSVWLLTPDEVAELVPPKSNWLWPW